MSDIRTLWNGLSGGVWALDGASLAADDGLETAVVLSLFTDRLDAAAPAGARRGWWGDAVAEVPGDLLGSRLWTLAREKQTPQVLGLAVAYTQEALAWLVDDGVARSVGVSADWVATGVLGLVVTINRTAKPVVQFRFERFWKGL